MCPHVKPLLSLCARTDHVSGDVASEGLKLTVSGSSAAFDAAPSRPELEKQSATFVRLPRALFEVSTCPDRHRYPADNLTCERVLVLQELHSFCLARRGGVLDDEGVALFGELMRVVARRVHAGLPAC